jgi:hypothetical protein
VEEYGRGTVGEEEEVIERRLIWFRGGRKSSLDVSADRCSK